jgi:RNA polymerase sigma-70 factor (ECF subfamily)
LAQRLSNRIIKAISHNLSLMNETSLSLLASIRQSGDSESWNRLVELYAPLMRNWLRAYEVNGADAEDLIQEVLTVVFQELPSFKHNARTGAFRNWLRKILVHRMQNYWRGRKQHPPAKGGSSLLEQLNQLEDENSQLSLIWNERHDRDVITKLMELVRPRFESKTWEAFRRQMFEGQKAADVATALGLGIGSVYMARNRVLAALRREAEGILDSFS